MVKFSSKSLKQNVAYQIAWNSEKLENHWILMKFIHGAHFFVVVVVVVVVVWLFWSNFAWTRSMFCWESCSLASFNLWASPQWQKIGSKNALIFIIFTENFQGFVDLCFIGNVVHQPASCWFLSSKWYNFWTIEAGKGSSVSPKHGIYKDSCLLSALLHSADN